MSNFIASVGGLGWQWAPVQCRVLLSRAGHPLVTSTTPDVSLKHTETGGGDDDDVLEKGHYHDDDDDDVLDVLEEDGRDDDDHTHGEE